MPDYTRLLNYCEWWFVVLILNAAQRSNNHLHVDQHANRVHLFWLGIAASWKTVIMWPLWVAYRQQVQKNGINSLNSWIPHTTDLVLLWWTFSSILLWQQWRYLTTSKEWTVAPTWIDWYLVRIQLISLVDWVLPLVTFSFYVMLVRVYLLCRTRQGSTPRSYQRLQKPG